MKTATGSTGSGVAADRCTETLAATSLKAAQLIAASPNTIRLHTGGNSYGDSAPWPDTAPLRPWTVYPATVDGHFRSLAIDLDASKGEAAGEAEVIIAEMRREGLKAVLVCSGPSGGRHIFATFDVLMPIEVVDEIKRRLVARFRTIDHTSMLKTSTIRPPGAPHRNGGHSIPVDPADPDEMLAILAEGNPPSAVRSYLAALGVPRWWADVAVPSGRSAAQAMSLLSPAGQDLLRTGVKSTGRDRTRSAVLFSFLMSARAAGLDYCDCYQLLIDPTNGAGKRFRDRTDLPRLHLDWLKACDKAAAPIANEADARQRIVEFEQGLDRQDWSGQAGNTDRIVIGAILKISLQAATITPRVSARQLAESTMFRPNTVTQSWKRLEDRGLITILQKGSRGRGTLMRINVDDELRYMNTPSTKGGVLSNVSIAGQQLRDSLHESFQSAGLSRSAQFVHSRLSTSEAASVVDLMAATSKVRSTVDDALEDLSEYGLARSDGDGKWFRVERDLDDVARDLGVDGSSDRRAMLHAFERDNYCGQIYDLRAFVRPDGGRGGMMVRRE